MCPGGVGGCRSVAWMRHDVPQKLAAKRNSQWFSKVKQLLGDSSPVSLHKGKPFTFVWELCPAMPRYEVFLFIQAVQETHQCVGVRQEQVYALFSKCGNIKRVIMGRDPSWVRVLWVWQAKA